MITLTFCFLFVAFLVAVPVFLFGAGIWAIGVIAEGVLGVINFFHKDTEGDEVEA